MLRKLFQTCEGACIPRALVCALVQHFIGRNINEQIKGSNHKIYMRMKQLDLLPRKNFKNDDAWGKGNGGLRKDAYAYFANGVKCEPYVPGAKRMLVLYDVELTPQFRKFCARMRGDESGQDARYDVQVDEDVYEMHGKDVPAFLALCDRDDVSDDDAGDVGDVDAGDVGEASQRVQQPVDMCRAPVNLCKLQEKYDALYGQMKHVVQERDAAMARAEEFEADFEVKKLECLNANKTMSAFASEISQLRNALSAKTDELQAVVLEKNTVQNDFDSIARTVLALRQQNDTLRMQLEAMETGQTVVYKDQVAQLQAELVAERQKVLKLTEEAAELKFGIVWDDSLIDASRPAKRSRVDFADW